MKTAIEYIKEAWGIYTKKENFIFFAKIMAVLTIASFSIGFVTSYFFPEDYINNIDVSNIPVVIGFVLASILAIVVGIWSQSTTYFSILKIGKSEKEIFTLGYKNIRKFFLISAVYALIIFFGVILLIIPTVIFGVWYSFSVLLVLDKNMEVGEALTKSKSMVKDRFFKIFGRYIVFGLFGLVVSIVVSIVPYAG